MAEVDLLRLLRGGGLEDEGEKDRFDGVTEGIVTEIGDDAHIGRVRVRFPYITDGCQSGWARLSAPWAGRNRGAYFVPEVDDEVLVAFEHGDLRFPYVLGSLWSATDPPQEPDPRRDRRGLRSKSGHLMVFDDGEARESLTLKSKGGRKIVLDDAPSGTKIIIADEKDLFSIVIDVTNKKIAVTATGAWRQPRLCVPEWQPPEPRSAGQQRGDRRGTTGRPRGRRRRLRSAGDRRRVHHRGGRLMDASFLGRGWSFPASADDDGEIRMVEDAEDVRQAILLILETEPGERDEQ
jgi:uncharacterized protein involved in type VI secretion and phage assembly